jgi:hypothetical protein
MIAVDVVVDRSFSGLTALNLSKVHLDDLASQGSIHRDIAASGRTTFKLRFRSAGRQVVRYLGGDVEFVNQIERELAQLQRAVKERRCSCRLLRSAGLQLRHSKRRLEPRLRLIGFHFYGREIRRHLANGLKIQERTFEMSEIYSKELIMEGSLEKSRDERALNVEVATDLSDQDQQHELFDGLKAEALQCPNRLQAAMRFEAALSMEITATLGGQIVKLLRNDAAEKTPAIETIALFGVRSVAHRQTMQLLEIDRACSDGQLSWNSPIPLNLPRPEK